MVGLETINSPFAVRIRLTGKDARIVNGTVTFYFLEKKGIVFVLLGAGAVPLAGGKF